MYTKRNECRRRSRREYFKERSLQCHGVELTLLPVGRHLPELCLQRSDAVQGMRRRE
jgi:hypothetical protein